MKKILVVGGVAGGASFAARMRRLDEQARIILFEKGGYISFANCGLPYHIGEKIRDRESLIIQTPERFKARFNIDIRTQSEVAAIDTVNKKVTVKNNGSSYDESYDYLVLSPGADPIRPPIPGIDNERIVTLRTISDMDTIKARVDNGSIKHAAIIGGGFIGLEMAENLHKRGIEVSLIELTDQVFAAADPEMARSIEQHLQLNGIKLYLGDGASSFIQKSDGAIDIALKSGKTVSADLVILAIGVKPDTAFVKDSGIQVTDRGAVIVDDRLRTSAADVFAVGDAIEVIDFVSGKKVHVPLAGPANRQGRIVADTIAGLDSSYKQTQGTAICKIFDIAGAVTGLNEKNAQRYGIAYHKSYTHSFSHAGYYPGAYLLSVKILFAPRSGKLLGAQVVGNSGVDKRIDVFATAVRHGLTVHDLTELELAYAPPYGSAKDAVNIAGFVAENIMNGTMPVWYAEDLPMADGNSIILDVRTKAEHEQGAIANSVVIPIDELRGRLGELDKSKVMYVHCQVGARGHLATRMLLQNGFQAKNLSGGYKTFTAYGKKVSETALPKPAPAPVNAVLAAPVSGKHSIVDACGLQCPGPILKLKQAVDGASPGETLEIRATDQGFAADIPSWCARTGNLLISLGNDQGVYVAVVKKRSAGEVPALPGDKDRHKTMVIFSNDLDRAMAAFIISNGAVSMGSEVTLFFTFWGLNLLRKAYHVKTSKSIIERMFGMMMPRGAAESTLSKMHMAGMGTLMLRKVMKKKNVYSLTTLMEEARRNGVRFVACAMSMDIMGIKKEELIEGVEIGGVANYLEKADRAGYNLFI